LPWLWKSVQFSHLTQPWQRFAGNGFREYQYANQRTGEVPDGGAVFAMAANRKLIEPHGPLLAIITAGTMNRPVAHCLDAGPTSNKQTDPRMALAAR